MNQEGHKKANRIKSEDVNYSCCPCLIEGRIFWLIDTEMVLCAYDGICGMRFYAKENPFEEPEEKSDQSN